MQVPCDEGIAIHIGPESCAVAREGLGGQQTAAHDTISHVPTEATMRSRGDDESMATARRKQCQ